VLFVFRPIEGHYHLVGECFVNGFMDGKGVEGGWSGKRRLLRFFGECAGWSGREEWRVWVTALQSLYYSPLWDISTKFEQLFTGVTRLVRAQGLLSSCSERDISYQACLQHSHNLQPHLKLC